MFLLSLFLGTPSTHSFFFADVNFKCHSSKYIFPTNGNIFMKAFSISANACLKNRLFKIATLGYLHTFIHEMGHALANKILGGNRSTINIEIAHDAPLGGSTSCQSNHVFVSLAGPLTDVVFSGCCLVASAALKNYISWQFPLILSISSVVWITGELTYAMVSAINQDNGDFGQIAWSGFLPLLFSTATLVGTSALSIILAYRYLK